MGSCTSYEKRLIQKKKCERRIRENIEKGGMIFTESELESNEKIQLPEFVIPKTSHETPQKGSTIDIIIGDNK